MMKAALLLFSLLAVTASLPGDWQDQDAEMMSDPESQADMMYYDPELNVDAMFDEEFPDTAVAEVDEEFPDAAVAEDYEEFPDTAVAEDVFQENDEDRVEDSDEDAEMELINQGRKVPVYQYYRAKVGRYYYTTNPRATEKAALRRYGFRYRGVTCKISPARRLGMLPLFRLFNKAGGHVYTTSRSEVSTLLRKRHIFGGPVVRGGPRVIGYCYKAPVRGTVPLIRWTRGKLPRYYTIYTTKNTPNNIAFMERKGYLYAGITCYVFP